MDHMGPQFQTVYRGLTAEPGDVNTKHLGTHWTTDKGVAEDFAVFDTDGNAGSGTVITGAVHNRHVVSGVERKNLRASHDVFGSDHREAEVPVRPGAVVHVLGAERHDGSTLSPASLALGRRRTGRA